MLQMPLSGIDDNVRSKRAINVESFMRFRSTDRFCERVSIEYSNDANLIIKSEKN